MMLLAACLLAGSVQAEGLFGGRPEPGRMPSRFVRIEPMDFGAGAFSIEMRLLRATYQCGRFRAGVGVFDGYAVIDRFGGGMVVPLHVGYTLWAKPRRTAFFYGMVPDVYAELSATPFGGGGGAFSFTIDPAAKLTLCCDADYYGLGAGIEAGWLFLPTRYGGSPYDDWNQFYFCVRARVIPFGIGF